MVDDNGGPYLNAAMICEKILQERDGVNSLIRLIDRITIEGGPGAPKDLSSATPIPVSFSLYLAFKSGNAQGNHTLEVLGLKPDQSSDAPMRKILNFEAGENRGVNLLIPINMLASMAGIYWIVTSLNGKFLTKTPLKLIYIPPAQPSA